MGTKNTWVRSVGFDQTQVNFQYGAVVGGGAKWCKVSMGSLGELGSKIHPIGQMWGPKFPKLGKNNPNWAIQNSE